MKRYELLEHTADTGVRAFGRSRPELFENAALGMLDILADAHTVRPLRKVKLKVIGANLEELLVNWLCEILYEFSARKMLLKEFEFERITDTEAVAVAKGESIDPARHAIKKEIKAVTYHELEIKKDSMGRLVAQVIFDI